MKLSSLLFFTDENIDYEVVAWLRSIGFDVLDIKEEGLFGMKDEDILKLATEQKRVVISQDSDFGTLIFRDSALVYGILFLQPGHVNPSIHIQTIKSVLVVEDSLQIEIPFILVAENVNGRVKVRLRNI